MNLQSDSMWSDCLFCRVILCGSDCLFVKWGKGVLDNSGGDWGIHVCVFGGEKLMLRILRLIMGRIGSEATIDLIRINLFFSRTI